VGRVPGRSVAAAVAASLALAACASGERPPPGPSPFRTARRIVLVRRVQDPKAQRPRDPIDALKESLDARGYETRVVEVVPGQGGELRDLERLEESIASRLYREPGAGRVEPFGADAGAVVARLGADAVAGCHRFDPSLGVMAPPPPPTWTTPSERKRWYAAAVPPAGALSLAAADGRVAWFPWGGGAADLDAHAPANAAEAIDAVVAALAGTPGDDR